MVIPIIPKATAGDLAPQRTFRARLAANRQLRGVAIIGALVLALIASLVIGRALSSERTADTALPAASAGSAAAYAVSPPNERDVDAGLPAAPAGQARVIQQDPDADAIRAGADQASAFVPGFTQTREDHRLPVTVAAPGFTAAYTGACRSDVAGCVPEEQILPGVPAPTAPVGTGRQQAELYGIEVRDNGAGTAGGNSGPCRSPGASCDR